MHAAATVPKAGGEQSLSFFSLSFCTPPLPAALLSTRGVLGETDA